MMLRLISITFFLLIIGCNNTNELEIKKEGGAIDTLITPKEEFFEGKKAEEDNILISKILENPINLEEYKRNYGTSHSSPTNNNFYYKPDTLGFYYSYYFFIEQQRKFKGKSLRDFYITVYKYGSVVGNFYDTNEELIELKSKINMHLGELDIIGLEKKDVLNRFGNPFQTDTDFIIYSLNNIYLIIRLNNNNVVWFKYVKAESGYQSLDQFPKELLKF